MLKCTVNEDTMCFYFDLPRAYAFVPPIFCRYSGTGRRICRRIFVILMSHCHEICLWVDNWNICLKVMDKTASIKRIPGIAVFASGNGSNAQRIADYFKENGLARITAIYCNNPNAYVLERARAMQVPAVQFQRDAFYNTTAILGDLKQRETDWIVLAGFLWLMPAYILQAYPQRVVNIHPALLPAHGGKGMYGMHVHQAVIQAGDAESGITIHYVNEKYDEGDVIFQARCSIDHKDTPEMLAAKIHELEYAHFPKVISDLVAEG